MEKNYSKPCRDLDLDQTMPNVKFVRAILYTTVCSSFKWIERLFYSYRAHTRTRTHTHGHEYSIVAVYQL